MGTVGPTKRPGKTALLDRLEVWIHDLPHEIAAAVEWNQSQDRIPSDPKTNIPVNRFR